MSTAGPEPGGGARWAELKALFNAALDGTREEWPSLLANVRQRDPALADQLQALLDGHVDSLIKIKSVRFENLEPGARLGPYVVTGFVDEGGMGQVYRARDERLGREVAIKVLLPELAHDADRRARMEREARAMGMLNHPNVVTVYDIGDHEGSPYIVSEFLEGQTLRQQLVARATGGSRLTPVRAVEIVACVADALGAAHRRGIVHRDIKPENIFLTDDGRVKVLDFGIAKLVESDAPGDGTVLGTIIGTPAYMTPEQLRGEATRAESDVYSCGVVLYELLAGVRPYAGKSQTALIGAVLHQPAPPLVDVAPSLGALVARCLDKTPEARYTNGAELAAALRALGGLANDSREAHVGAHPVQPVPARQTRNLVMAALLTAAVGGGVMWLQQPEVSPSPSSSAAGTDIALPFAMTSSPAPVSDAPGRERPLPSPATSSATPSGQAASGPAAAASQVPTLEPPAPTPTAVAAPELSGIWTVDEQITEDAQAIACTGAGALQLRFDDGLLDGTLRLKRDCRDSARSTTDSTESTAAISAGTHLNDAVSFVTRVVDEGLVTTCRYSSRIVGSTKGNMAGEVSCEARAAGISSVLVLRGTWRASRMQ